MSNQKNKMDHDRFQILLMGAIDRELTEQDRTEFEFMIQNNSEFNKEYEQYKKLKEVTNSMKFKSPPAEVWDKYWLGIYNRIERGIGWIIFSIGFILLSSYAIYKFIMSLITDPNLDSFVKFGVLTLVTGLVILIVSVFREKLTMRHSDPYKEIQR